MFDSEPEFKAMLEDTKPTYRTQSVDEASFCLFVNRDGMIVSSTNDHYPAGLEIELPRQMVTAAKGEMGTLSLDMDNQTYIVGYKMAEGYREYKNGDGYENDVLAMILTGIK